MKCSLVLLTVVMVCASEWGVGTEAQSLFHFPGDVHPCGPNERWKQCATVSCADITCWKRTLGPNCTAGCNYGCFCSEGFYRDGESHCVTLEQCPPGPGRAGGPAPQCGPNEEWKVCVSSTCAETTCEKRTIGRACRADCRRGCYCFDGFFRNAQGNCVTEDLCPAQE